MSTFKADRKRVPRIAIDMDMFEVYADVYEENTIHFQYPGGQLLAVDIENFTPGTGGRYLSSHPEYEELDFDIKDIWVFCPNHKESGWCKITEGFDEIAKYIFDEAWSKVHEAHSEAMLERAVCQGEDR